LEDIVQNILTRVRNPALRQGLIFGIILGVVLLALSLIFNNVIVTLALILLGAFLAGRRASQETERLATGTLAGLWTGLIGILLPSIISLVLILINIDAYRNSLQTAANKQHLHITYTNSQVLLGLAINFLIIIVFGILPGIIGGTLGGNFGRRRAQLLASQEYQETIVESSLETPSEEPPAKTPADETLSIIPPEGQSSPTEPIEPRSTNPSEEPSSHSTSTE
jgi:hypothetical protein